MPAHRTPTLALVTLTALGALTYSAGLAQAIRWEEIPERDSLALKTEMELWGGEVMGNPEMRTVEDAEENPIKAIYFPDTYAGVIIPVESHWHWGIEVQVRIDKPPFGESEGPIFGIVVGKNRVLQLGVTSKLFSPTQSFDISSGDNILTGEKELESAIKWGIWQRLGLAGQTSLGAYWGSTVGEVKGNGKIPEENMGLWAVSRENQKAIKLGGFEGYATIPTYEKRGKLGEK